MSDLASGITEELMRRYDAGVPCGVAAVLLGESAPPDVDGWRWRVAVRDDTTVATIEVEAADRADGPPNKDQVAQFVEHRAGDFAVETRLADLVAASPLVMRRDR